MPARAHSFKPRGKIDAEDQEVAYQGLLRNSSQKHIYDFIVGSFSGQGNTEIKPDMADVSNVRYLLTLAAGGSPTPSSDFFAACFLYFQRSNSAYSQRLRQLEQAASEKLVKED